MENAAERAVDVREIASERTVILTISGSMEVISWNAWMNPEMISFEIFTHLPWIPRMHDNQDCMGVTALDYSL